MEKIILLIFIVAGFFLSGCAPQYHDKPLDVNTGKGALVDIKQRAILVHDESRTDGKLSVCAEPSPDALSAYAVELYRKNKDSESGLLFSETAEYIGLRTQSIQLLRDALYRLCEGFLSGALDSSVYEIFMYRYQKYMIAALAIEQLTNAVKVPPPSIVIKSSPSKSVENVSISYHQSKEGIEKVAEVVRSMVDKALDDNRDTNEMCQIYLTKQADGGTAEAEENREDDNEAKQTADRTKSLVNDKSKKQSKEDVLFDFCIKKLEVVKEKDGQIP